MKKLFTLFLSFCASGAIYAQSTRLQLIEEFTGENCPPCAATNPGFNALLEDGTNPTKIVAIKYQSPIPSAGPLFNQNKVDVNARLSYYGVNSAPNARQDGLMFATSTPNPGHPANFKQSDIDSRSAVSSPFSMTVTHNLSVNADSVYVKVVIKATQAVTGTLAAQIAVIERNIFFKNAPGTNGEKKFEGVMKKMLPSATGTILPSSFAVNDSIVINQAWKLANVYDLTQLAVVAFVQNNTSKEVQQAAYSAPQPLALDAGISEITSVPLFQCTNTVNPKVTLKNFGSTTLTAATISYKLDNGSPLTQAWTGSLATNQTETVNLPAQTISPSTGTSHTLSVSVSDPNAQVDINTNNNGTETIFNIFSAASTSPLKQDFQLSAFPPAGWVVSNPDQGKTWERSPQAGGFGKSSASAKINFNGSPANQVDEMISQNYDLTGLSTNKKLQFDVAYAQASTSNTDKISVLVSTDCGTTWTSIYEKSGADLVTSTTIESSNFFYPDKTEWRKEIIDLTPYIGQANVLFSFRAESGGYGNNGFIDNIVVDTVSLVGITNISKGANNVNVYPNPFTTSTKISFSLDRTEKVTLNVYNALGALVSTVDGGLMNAGEGSIEFNAGDLPTGIYSVNLVAGNSTITKRVVLNK